MTKKFTFIGCSFTVGVGLLLEKDDPNNYTNIVANNYNANITNLAVGGNSNYNIFITTLNEIVFNQPDKIFVQWSVLNRLWIYPGPDTELTLSHTIKDDYKYCDIYYSKKQLQELTNAYHILNHDYKNLITLINYCNILTRISDCQIIFINGLLPWTQEISDKNTATNFSDNLSAYSKELLEFDTRDDDELNKFFSKLNVAVTSLDKRYWVNMFNSLQNQAIDLGNDNAHPGIKSHQRYADMIIKYIEDNNDKRI
jgi:hypothetical protein